MHKQKSLESRDINYIYENSFVWVNINSIKQKNVGLCKAIQEYYKNKSSLFCFFKGQVRRFVSKGEAQIYIYIDGEGEDGNVFENIDYTITEHVRYLLPVDTNFGCSDNTQLIYLNSPNLLENIYQRYTMAYMREDERNCIYTYIGYILISVNPYAIFNIYDEDYMRKVKGEENLFNLPHPFSIANDAYHSMLKDNKSQSIIISGESGSGKTESSKQVLNYLTFLSASYKNEHRVHYPARKNQKVITYEKKIQNSNPLLETFGNAKTIKNDNSSRFGKLMRLNYDYRGGLKSASIETYLLAKSRVVDVPEGESNYHIFYSLCEDEQLKKEFHLLPWYQYNYLIPQKGIMEPEKKKSKSRSKQSIDSTKSYQCLYDLETIRECFNSIGVFEAEQKEIYKTLICILLLGNVEFVESEKEGEALQIKNLELCEYISRLLELHKEPSETNKIVEILTVKKVREFQKNYTQHQAVYNRDVIAKALYQLIFEYVILRVNDSLNRNETKSSDFGRDLSEELQEEEEPVGKEKCRKKRKKKGVPANEKPIHQDIHIEEIDEEEEEGRIHNFIGILDIYGFENFSFEGTNGYEQLCINYANEILHSFFLKQIIENEHKIHYEENLNLQKFQYNDNSTVISLIGNTKDVSIYTILEDLALLSTSNKSSEKDKNEVFFEKMTKSVIHCAKYKSVIRNYKKEKNAFIISHFAGDVLYDTNDFVNKNMDILTSDIEQFLLSCNPFISNNLLNKISYEVKKHERKDSSAPSASLLRVEESKTSKRKMSVKEMINRHEIDPKSGGSSMNQIYKNKVKSIFSYFKKQLEILINKLEKTSSKFIRCIKPNQWKEPKIFDKNLVLNQLVMSGMVDILNLMKNGFPCRIIYEDIWNSYNSLLQEDMREFLTPRMFCELILKFLEIDKNEYKFGKTKVFFRFGVLSIINEVLNKDETRKGEFLKCVYKYWFDWRKRRILNFVLFGCRFKILFKKRRAKYLMEIGLEVYNQYWFQKQLQKAEVIAYYYFYVYKSRCYFLQLRESTLFLQKNIRCYLTRKKYLYMKRQILFIQDYYLFHTYFKKRVFSADVIRKNWLTYITRYDYLYVLKCIRIIQREFKKYLKRKYRDYYLNMVQSRESVSSNIKEKVYVKQEVEEEEKKELLNLPLRKKSSRYEEDENRMCSFIYIEKNKNQSKPRHSFSFGYRPSSSFSKDTNGLKRRNTWNWSEEKRNKENHGAHNMYKYTNKKSVSTIPQINIIQHSQFNNIQNKGFRGVPNEDKMFVSVGNSMYDERNLEKESDLKKKGKSYLSPGGACTLKRRSLLDMNAKSNETNLDQRERKKGSRAFKNTIYDRYIDKYKQTHNNPQNNKRKRSVYIKNNYSNISNIYSVYRATKKETKEMPKEQYNFDVIDMLIIPEDFYVCDSYIPEASIELENNTNYIMLCHYLDNNLNSKIPIIGMDTFRIN